MLLIYIEHWMFEFLCGRWHFSRNVSNMYSRQIALNNYSVNWCCDFSWIFPHSRVALSSTMTLKCVAHYQQLTLHIKIRPPIEVSKENSDSQKCSRVFYWIKLTPCNVEVYLNLTMTTNMKYLLNAIKGKFLLEKFTHVFFS